tara:strand:+ start:370 stop:489 length:120 start_codon:yes stop_codon:yes gene_type:complete
MGIGNGKRVLKINMFVELPCLEEFLGVIGISFYVGFLSL